MSTPQLPPSWLPEVPAGLSLAAHGGNGLHKAPTVSPPHSVSQGPPPQRTVLGRPLPRAPLLGVSNPHPTDGEAGVGAVGRQARPLRPGAPLPGPVIPRGLCCPEPRASVPPGGHSQAVRTSPTLGCIPTRKALRPRLHRGWGGMQVAHCPPLLPGRAVLAQAGAEKGKKHGPRPGRTSCPAPCPGATAQPKGQRTPPREGHVIGPITAGRRGSWLLTAASILPALLRATARPKTPARVDLTPRGAGQTRGQSHKPMTKCVRR